MSYTRRIEAKKWAHIYSYLSDIPKIHTNDEARTRQFVEGVFWLLRSGSQWRMLPPEGACPGAGRG